MYLEQGKDLSQAIPEDFKPGISHIKIVNSGVNSLSEFGRETSPQFTNEELSERKENTGNPTRRDISSTLIGGLLSASAANEQESEVRSALRCLFDLYL